MDEVDIPRNPILNAPIVELDDRDGQPTRRERALSSHQARMLCLLDDSDSPAVEVRI